MESPCVHTLYPRDPLLDYTDLPLLDTYYQENTTSSPESFFSSHTTSPSTSHCDVTSMGQLPQASPLIITPPSSGGSSSKRKVSDSEGDSLEDEGKATKRQRNTMAARKYRQKRLDLISDLEKALEEMTAERNELKLQLARKDAEAGALREMLAKK